MSKILSKLKDEKGQALVEFALVALIFFLILFAITEFGWAWYRLDVLKNAANIAARTYAIDEDPGKAKAAAESVVERTLPSTDFLIDTTSDQVTVTVKEQFKTVVSDFPVLGQALGGTTGITLSRDATYRMEQ